MQSITLAFDWNMMQEQKQQEEANTRTTSPEQDKIAEQKMRPEH